MAGAADGSGPDGAGPSGLVVVDKPAGPTSHDVVAALRRRLGTRRVGHAGTLDPAATGVLVVGVGRATRLLGHLQGTDKAYEATVRLGVGTHTDDAGGRVLARPGAGGVGAADVAAAAAAFTGPLLQRPSAVSAVKVAGRRAHVRVRAGEDVELPPRPVVVHALEVRGTRAGSDGEGTAVLDVDVAVRCSSGTYVRALARDMGAALGTAGHLTALRRTAVGPFGQDRALPPDEAPLLGLDEVVPELFAVRRLGAAEAGRVRHGVPLPWAGPAAPAPPHGPAGQGGPVALLGPDGQVLALAERRAGPGGDVTGYLVVLVG